jgi:hypothetical protein
MARGHNLTTVRVLSAIAWLRKLFRRYSQPRFPRYRITARLLVNRPGKTTIGQVVPAEWAQRFIIAASVTAP